MENVQHDLFEIIKSKPKLSNHNLGLSLKEYEGVQLVLSHVSIFTWR